MMCELGERLMNVSDRVLGGRHSETGSVSQVYAVRPSEDWFHLVGLTIILQKGNAYYSTVLTERN